MDWDASAGEYPASTRAFIALRAQSAKLNVVVGCDTGNGKPLTGSIGKPVFGSVTTPPVSGVCSCASGALRRRYQRNKTTAPMPTPYTHTGNGRAWPGAWSAIALSDRRRDGERRVPRGRLAPIGVVLLGRG